MVHSLPECHFVEEIDAYFGTGRWKKAGEFQTYQRRQEPRKREPPAIVCL